MLKCALAIFAICFSMAFANEEEIALLNPRKKLSNETAQMQNCCNVNPSARGCPCNNDPFITADFLWWRPTEDDQGYTFKNTDLTRDEHGRIVRNNYEWDPGFRVGLGWNTPYDGWDTLLNWTCYENTTTNSITSPTNGVELGLSSTWLSSTVDAIGFASSKWHLTYNMFDWELGRAFCVSRALNLRPFVGARGGWIHRRWENFYNLPSIPAVAPDNFSIVPGNYTSKVHEWGVGPRFGINTEWLLCRGFQVFGNFSTSFLYGRMYARTLVTQTNQATRVPPDETSSLRDSTWHLLTNFQLILGLGWGTCFRCDTMYFSMKLGWEISEYMNLYSFQLPSGRSTSIFSDNSNLSLVGLTYALKFDF